MNENGFSTFVDPENNEYYFAYTEEGKVILRSEGYAQAAGRDNGVASVIKNMVDESKYKARMLPDGRWVLSLKAANHQEIARSCPVDNEAAALALLPSARAEAQAQRLSASASPEAGKSNSNIDEYLACANYENHSEEYAGIDNNDINNLLCLKKKPVKCLSIKY